MDTPEKLPPTKLQNCAYSRNVYYTDPKDERNNERSVNEKEVGRYNETYP